MKLSSRAGFGIVQVVVAGVLGGIIMLGLNAMINSTMQAQRQVSSRAEIADTMNRIAIFLTNGAACTSYLQNKSFNPDPGVIAGEVLGDEASEEFSIFVPGQPTNIVAQKGQTIDSAVSIERLEVRNFSRVAGSNFAASLVVTFNNKAGGGPRSVMRDLSLSLSTVPEVVGGVTKAKITKCNSKSISSGFGNFEVFTANGTFVVPPDTDRIMVEVWGGGGGGGGGFSNAAPPASAGGGGGGSGGFARSILNVTPGSSHAITVGAGGSAGSGTAGGAGTNGTAGLGSSFGALVSANGGLAGNTGYFGGTGTPGLGGTATGQDAITGTAGMPGQYLYSAELGAAGGPGGHGFQSVGDGGTGGTAYFGAGDRIGRPGKSGRVVVYY